MLGARRMRAQRKRSKVKTHRSKVAVKVVDIFGNDTMKIIEATV
jgi:hypothetical protein